MDLAQIDQASRRLFLAGAGSLILAGCRSAQMNHSDEDMGFYYRVRRGDTLFWLSDQSGVSLEQLRASNRLVSDQLNVGQLIYIPGEGEVPGMIGTRKVPDWAKKTHKESYPKIETKDLFSPPSSKKPYIVPRSQWGAKPTASNSGPMGGIYRITIHHTSEHKGMDGKSDLEVVRGIARYHRDELGWADIGYHYLIGRDGRIYEGRPDNIRGAHVKGHNQNNLGISMIGNFTKRHPTARQTEALQALVYYQMDQHNLSRQRIYCHRDFANTECPGDNLYQWVKGFINGLS
ncbi:MAG: N-acetylmuramoyl-L-alanine amidase [Planctomycetes bacterium]|nr:N-acetylmuramoyl-L-alanine amidase [Planctomycetota bacterium]